MQVKSPLFCYLVVTKVKVRLKDFALQYDYELTMCNKLVNYVNRADTHCSSGLRSSIGSAKLPRRALYVHMALTAYVPRRFKKRKRSPDHYVRRVASENIDCGRMQLQEVARANHLGGGARDGGGRRKSVRQLRVQPARAVKGQTVRNEVPVSLHLLY